MQRKIKALGLLFTLSIGTTLASDSTSSVKKSKNWSLSTSATLNTSMHHLDDAEKSISSDLGVSHSYKFKNGVRMFTSVSGNKNLQGERKWNWSNSAVGLSTTLGQSEAGRVGGTLIGYIPTSEYSKKYQKMITGFKASPSFTIFGKNFGINSMSISYVPNAALYFHEYTTALTGGSNTQYSLGNALSVNYGFSDQVSMNVTGSYNRRVTYEGGERDSFGFAATAGYSPTAQTSLSLGYANGGSPLAANGSNTDIDIFDERSAAMFFSLGYTF
ncbi:MAG: hypothetical protein KC493_07045 [Bacteriovoracaceae bacterium]|nr:hypothetical protein [Bacteriovoracaceae bacterium]